MGDLLRKLWRHGRSRLLLAPFGVLGLVLYDRTETGNPSWELLVGLVVLVVAEFGFFYWVLRVLPRKRAREKE